MDVGILMRDKTVEDLDALQATLQKQMEEEREELREMVGRRYRDVLEASAEVRTVHKMAEEVVTSLTASRSTHVPPESLASSRLNAAADTHRLIALHYLLPLISNSSDLDSLNTGYGLVLAEQLHRSLLRCGTMDERVTSLLPHLTRRLALTRKKMITMMNDDLSSCSRSDWASNELAAICLVEGKGIEGLLDQYLMARKRQIKDELESGSLLTVVSEVKETLRVVESLFSQGELLAVLQAITAPHFKPQVCVSLQSDSAFSSFSSMLSLEMEKVNRSTREKKMGTITTQKINEKCARWIEDVCSSARSSVSVIMEYYESLDEIIQFVDALTDIVGNNWPRIGSSNSWVFMEKLLGTVVVDRFKSVVSLLISSSYSSFCSSLLSLSSLESVPLFEKRRTKFDPLMARGVSHSLNQSVLSLLTSITSIRETTNRFEKVIGEGGAGQSIGGGESTSSTVSRDSVRDALADQVVQMFERVCTELSLPPSSSSQSIDNHLFKARVALALLHCDPACMCKILNRDGTKISKCSTMLHSSIEKSLSCFVCDISSEFVSSDRSVLSEFILEWDSVDLPEVGKVHVPLLISSKVHDALIQLCYRLSSLSLSHLLSRSIRVKLTTAIASHLIPIYSNIIAKHSPSLSFPQRTLLQLLFDVRVLSSLFPLQDSKSGWKSLSSSIESRIDPFDLSLLSPLLAANIKIAIQRIQLTLAPLLLDVMPSKDSVSSSSLHLIDILPRSVDDYLPRIPPIPRLDRSTSSDPSKSRGINGIAGRSKIKNSLLANESSGMTSKPSISSFVDKISSSWFGN